MNLVAVWGKIRAFIGKLRKALNDGHDAGLWPNKGKGPDVGPKK